MRGILTGIGGIMTGFSGIMTGIGRIMTEPSSWRNSSYIDPVSTYESVSFISAFVPSTRFTEQI